MGDFCEKKEVMPGLIRCFDPMENIEVSASHVKRIGRCSINSLSWLAQVQLKGTSLPSPHLVGSEFESVQDLSYGLRDQSGVASDGLGRH